MLYSLLIIPVYLVLETFWITYFGLRAVEDGKKTTKYEQHPINSSSKILFIGDSIGLGVGATKPQFSLAGLVGSQFPEADLTNFSKNGVRIHEIFEYVQKQSLVQYDFIFVVAGGMDVIKTTNLKKFKKTLVDFTSFLKNHSDKIIFLPPQNTGSLPLYHAPVGLFLNWRARQIGKVFRQVAEEKSCVIADASLSELLKNKKKYFSHDLCHPNDLGYKLWYESIQKFLT